MLFVSEKKKKKKKLLREMTVRESSSDSEYQLITGYVRIIQNTIIKQIIPHSIIKIFIDFYRYKPKYLFYLTQKVNMNRLSPMYIIDVNDKYYTYKCKIINHDSSESIVIPGDELQDDQNDKWVLDNCALYHKSNFKLPQNIHQNIMNNYNDLCLDNKYDIIFKSGGEYHNISPYISMICINHNEFIKANDDTTDNKEILAIDYQLPSIKHETANVCSALLLRNDNNELISIGGWDSNKCYKLSLNDDTLQWTEMASLQECRAWSSCSMIDDNKLIVIGGYHKNNALRYQGINTVEMFDFNDNKWKYVKSLKKPIYQSGCCYDKNSEQIYVGGGNCDSSGICYFNMNKNKWVYDLGETVFHHKNYPLIWIQDINYLYLSSCIGCKVRTELIDLRASNKGWMKLDFNEIDVVFGVKNSSCRIIV